MEQMMATAFVKLVLQWDSNAVIYSFISGKPTWASGTHGKGVDRTQPPPLKN